METEQLAVGVRVGRWFDAHTYLRGKIIDADPGTGQVMVKWDIGLAGWYAPLLLDVIGESDTGGGW